MSVIRSLYVGAAGLAAHGEAVSAIGDNIANANTIGFKRSRANFEDVLARSVGGGADQGLGSRIASMQKILSQGGLLGTGVGTDLAINGRGFFVVKGKAAGLDATFYTRAGQFKLDKSGNLVNLGGLKVQGYSVDALGNLRKDVGDIKVPSAQIPPTATTKTTLIANLDSGSTTPSKPFTTADPSAGSNFSTSVKVYDSLGKGHTVTIYFRKEPATGAWSWHALVDGGEITGGTKGTPVEAASGTLSFDSKGRLKTATTTKSDFDFLGAEQNQNIAFDFGDPLSASGGTGLAGVTSYASKSVVTRISQDGAASGSLSGISIDADGTITGVFTNGSRRTVGKVLLATFANAQDLQRIGSNLFAESSKSGPPLVGEATKGGRGAIKAGTLEQSNVDLSTEFVGLIAYQRGYQANSRTVTTADQLLQETLNLKR